MIDPSGGRHDGGATVIGGGGRLTRARRRLPLFFCRYCRPLLLLLLRLRALGRTRCTTTRRGHGPGPDEINVGHWSLARWYAGTHVVVAVVTWSARFTRPTDAESGVRLGEGRTQVFRSRRRSAWRMLRRTSASARA